MKIHNLVALLLEYTFPYCNWVTLQCWLESYRLTTLLVDHN